MLMHIDHLTPKQQALAALAKVTRVKPTLVLDPADNDGFELDRIVAAYVGQRLFYVLYTPAWGLSEELWDADGNGKPIRLNDGSGKVLVAHVAERIEGDGWLVGFDVENEGGI